MTGGLETVTDVTELLRHALTSLEKGSQELSSAVFADRAPLAPLPGAPCWGPSQLSPAPELVLQEQHEACEMETSPVLHGNQEELGQPREARSQMLPGAWGGTAREAHGATGTAGTPSPGTSDPQS